MSPLTSPRPRHRIRRASQEVSELNFNDDDMPVFSSDGLMDDETADIEAGLVGAAAPAFEPTSASADDLTPETLIDEDNPDSLLSNEAHPADAMLRCVQARELFSDPSDRDADRP